MRLTMGVLASGLMLASPAATETLFPSVRSDPAQRDRGPDTVIAPTPNQVPNRAPLRDATGAVGGFHDRGSGSNRGLARDSDGTLDGWVVPNRSGGGVVRGSDGSFESLAPSGARTERFHAPDYGR